MAETIGSLVDKLSIVELKIFHMREQSQRNDATAAFREECGRRLEVLGRQRDDLATELSHFLGEIAAGRASPKIYRQYKMYNDPQYKKS